MRLVRSAVAWFLVLLWAVWFGLLFYWGAVRPSTPDAAAGFVEKLKTPFAVVYVRAEELTLSDYASIAALCLTLLVIIFGLAKRLSEPKES